MNKVYDVYQYHRHIGRYGEHVRIATYKKEADAKRKVDLIWSAGRTASYKPRAL